MESKKDTKRIIFAKAAYALTAVSFGIGVYAVITFLNFDSLAIAIIVTISVFSVVSAIYDFAVNKTGAKTFAVHLVIGLVSTAAAFPIVRLLAVASLPSAMITAFVVLSVFERIYDIITTGKAYWNDGTGDDFSKEKKDDANSK